MLSFWLGQYGLTPGQCCNGEAEAAGEPGERAEEKSAGETLYKYTVLFVDPSCSKKRKKISI